MCELCMLWNERDTICAALTSHLAIYVYIDSHLKIQNTQYTKHSPNVWFSSAYIIAGAAIIAVMLTVAGQQVEESASMSMFQSLQRRENYEKKMSRDNPLCTRIKAFLSYNAAYLIMITLWLCWLVFIIVWSMLMVDEWDFPEAQYFAVSLCSSAGSFSLPTTSSNTAYLLAGISMMIGVPLMAMGVSAIIIMVWQGHRFKTVKEAAWSDVTHNELELLGKLGIVDIGEGEELTKGGFILLGLFRMGQDVGVIKYLADAHHTVAQRGGVIIHASSVEGGDSQHHYAKVSGHQEGVKTRFSISDGDKLKGLSRVAESITTTTTNTSNSAAAAAAEENA